MIIPIEVKQIIERLESQGYEAYIVGGCVRDSLIGSEPHDWDICTNALPDQVRDIFEEEYNVIDTGIKHGTVTVVVRKLPFEITLVFWGTRLNTLSKENGTASLTPTKTHRTFLKIFEDLRSNNLAKITATIIYEASTDNFNIQLKISLISATLSHISNLLN